MVITVCVPGSEQATHMVRLDPAPAHRRVGARARGPVQTTRREGI